MIMELYFTLGVIIFVLVVLSMAIEHYIAIHWFKKNSFLISTLKSFEKQHPSFCDRDDNFYCFFNRSTFKLYQD